LPHSKQPSAFSVAIIWSFTAAATFVGPAPVLNVVDLGQRLLTLEDVANAPKLINKLRAGDWSASAQAELTAIYLLRSGQCWRSPETA